MPDEGLLLLGGGGHAASVISTVRRAGIFSRIGLVLNHPATRQIDGITVVGKDQDLPTLTQSFRYAFIAIGSQGDSRLREQLYYRLSQLGFQLPNIIDPSAIVSPDAIVTEGVFIGARCYLGPYAKVGCCSILNTASLAEHHCVLGNFVHLAPGSVLCGSVKIGSSSHIGAVSVVRENLSIGERSLVGMGSVVTKDVPSGVLAYGNPCRVIGSLLPKEKETK